SVSGRVSGGYEAVTLHRGHARYAMEAIQAALKLRSVRAPSSWTRVAASSNRGMIFCGAAQASNLISPFFLHTGMAITWSACHFFLRYMNNGRVLTSLGRAWTTARLSNL